MFDSRCEDFNRSWGFPTRSDTNRSVQPQKVARGLKFRMQVVEGLYYPYSENKGADQLRGYREADLCLCFRICKKPVFSRRGSFGNQGLLQLLIRRKKLSISSNWYNQTQNPFVETKWERSKIANRHVAKRTYFKEVCCQQLADF